MSSVTRAAKVHAAEQLSVEKASTGDADEIATLYLASRADALPYLRRVHTDNEAHTWIRNVVLTQGETWVARLRGSIVGFMALVGYDVDQLYVLPGYYRCGVGRKLLDLAKARSSGRLLLYTFQRNGRARAFYESQGFRIIDMTDGLRNEEKEPDIRYEWTPIARPGTSKVPPGQK